MKKLLLSCIAISSLLFLANCESDGEHHHHHDRDRERGGVTTTTVQEETTVTRPVRPVQTTTVETQAVRGY